MKIYIITLETEVQGTVLSTEVWASYKTYTTAKFHIETYARMIGAECTEIEKNIFVIKVKNYKYTFTIVESTLYEY